MQREEKEAIHNKAITLDEAGDVKKLCDADAGISSIMLSAYAQRLSRTNGLSLTIDKNYEAAEKSQKKSMSNSTVNRDGYSLRLGEKECSYYLSTGKCKFGVACKFHHLQKLASDFLRNYRFPAAGKVGSSTAAGMVGSCTDLIDQKAKLDSDMDKKHLKLSSQRELKPNAKGWLCRQGFYSTAIHGDKGQTSSSPILYRTPERSDPVRVRGRGWDADFGGNDDFGWNGEEGGAGDWIVNDTWIPVNRLVLLAVFDYQSNILYSEEFECPFRGFPTVQDILREIARLAGIDIPVELPLPHPPQAVRDLFDRLYVSIPPPYIEAPVSGPILVRPSALPLRPALAGYRNINAYYELPDSVTGLMDNTEGLYTTLATSLRGVYFLVW